MLASRCGTSMSLHLAAFRNLIRYNNDYRSTSDIRYLFDVCSDCIAELIRLARVNVPAEDGLRFPYWWSETASFYAMVFAHPVFVGVFKF